MEVTNRPAPELNQYTCPFTCAAGSTAPRSFPETDATSERESAAASQSASPVRMSACGDTPRCLESPTIFTVESPTFDTSSQPAGVRSDHSLATMPWRIG